MEPSDIVSTFSVLTPCNIRLCALFFSPSFCLHVHLLLFPSTLFRDLQLLLRSSPSNTNSTLSGLYLFCFLFVFFFALTTFSFMGRRAKRSREMENIFNFFSVSICHTAQLVLLPALSQSPMFLCSLSSMTLVFQQGRCQEIQLIFGFNISTKANH